MKSLPWAMYACSHWEIKRGFLNILLLLRLKLIIARTHNQCMVSSDVQHRSMDYSMWDWIKLTFYSIGRFFSIRFSWRLTITYQLIIINIIRLCIVYPFSSTKRKHVILQITESTFWDHICQIYFNKGFTSFGDITKEKKKTAENWEFQPSKCIVASSQEFSCQIPFCHTAVPLLSFKI